MKDIRVRYAPSPTGYLHIGNARTALFNYLFAKHHNGTFIVRIEDTDISRNVEDGVKSQLKNLQWLGIEWDESIDNEGEYGPYSQLERYDQKIYEPIVQFLLDNGYAYRCFCTSEELDKETQKQKENGEVPKYSGKCRDLTPEQIEQKLAAGEKYTIRLKVDSEDILEWDDMVKGHISFRAGDVSGDFNIVKSNGIPTYNFAVVVDDYLMKISHVLRGEDHISNTPKQLMIYQAMGWEPPKFGHMSLIVNENGKKLSKRDADIVQFIEEYKELGYLPEAMFNFIALLGWSPQGDQEIYSKEDLCNIFDENRLSKSSAKFDVNKLTWINNQYVKNLNDDDYLKLVKPFIRDIDFGLLEQNKIDEICLLFKDQLSYGAEIKPLVEEFLTFELEQEAKEFIISNGCLDILEVFRDNLLENQPTNIDDISSIIKTSGKQTDKKGKMLFMPIRIAISGKMHGPELPSIINIIGVDEAIKRINYTLNVL